MSLARRSANGHVDAVGLLAHQGLAGKLQQQPLVFETLRGSHSAHSQSARAPKTIRKTGRSPGPAGRYLSRVGDSDQCDGHTRPEDASPISATAACELADFLAEIFFLLVDAFAERIADEAGDLDRSARAALGVLDGLSDGLGGVVDILLLEQAVFLGERLDAAGDDLLQNLGLLALVLFGEDRLFRARSPQREPRRCRERQGSPPPHASRPCVRFQIASVHRPRFRARRARRSCRGRRRRGCGRSLRRRLPSRRTAAVRRTVMFSPMVATASWICVSTVFLVPG